MATYTKVVLKNGKIKYRIQVKITDPITKELTYHRTTWDNDKNLKETKALGEAKFFGREYENKIRNGEKTTRFIEIPTFGKLAEEWLFITKSTTSDNHYLKASRIIEECNLEWENIKITDFLVKDFHLFFATLSNRRYKSVTAKLKDGVADIFYNAVKENGFKKACTGEFSWATLFSARKGEQIQWNMAEAICRKFGLNINDIFEKNVIEKPYKKETIMGYQRVICAIFTYAEKNNLIAKNYASMKFIEKKRIGGKGVDKVEVLSTKEIANLIEVLEHSPIADSIPILLMLHLGLRKCEMCGLNWSDIDFERRIISITRDRIYVPKKGIAETALKTEKSERDLHIIDGLFRKLQEYKQYYEWLRRDDPIFNNSGAIFCNYDGTPRNPGFVDLLLRRFLVEANCHSISPHKLRHTWITTLISNGIAPNIVAQLAGHSTVETTLKVYTHYTKSADNSKDILERIFSGKKAVEPDWSFA